MRAYEGWKVAERDFAGYDYCWKNFLSAQSMKAIDSLRKEFLSLLRDTDLIDANTATYNVWSYDVHLVRAVICYGLYPGICSVMVSVVSSMFSLSHSILFFYKLISSIGFVQNVYAMIRPF